MCNGELEWKCISGLIYKSLLKMDSYINEFKLYKYRRVDVRKVIVSYVF